jgi:hypothetical protein
MLTVGGHLRFISRNPGSAARVNRTTSSPGQCADVGLDLFLRPHGDFNLYWKRR